MLREGWNVQNVTWRDVEQPAVAVVVVGHEQAGAEVRLVEDSVEIAFDAGGSGWKNGLCRAHLLAPGDLTVG